MRFLLVVPMGTALAACVVGAATLNEVLAIAGMGVVVAIAVAIAVMPRGKLSTYYPPTREELELETRLAKANALRVTLGEGR